jgi:hypothetical protein
LWKERGGERWQIIVLGGVVSLGGRRSDMFSRREEGWSWMRKIHGWTRLIYFFMAYVYIISNPLRHVPSIQEILKSAHYSIPRTPVPTNLLSTPAVSQTFSYDNHSLATPSTNSSISFPLSVSSLVFPVILPSPLTFSALISF